MKFPLTIAQVLAGVAIAAALLVLVFPPLPSGETRALALIIAALGLWATGAVPEHITAVGFFTMAMLFAVAPPAVVFGGFDSAALWLIFGGLVMGVAVIGVLSFGGPRWMVWLSLLIGIACDAEGLAMSLMLPRWRNDVKTLSVAWKLRGEMLEQRQEESRPIR